MSKLLLSSVLFLLVIGGCTPKRNLVYFNDVNQDSTFQMAIMNAHEPKIQAGDILSITVSSLDPASNAMFNTGALQSSLGQVSNMNAAGTTNLGKEGYLVGTDGNMNFPVVGKISLAGLTLAQAHQAMQKELIKYVKEPIVNLRYLNFRVTVIGEVKRPGSFTIDNERVNVLEALGLAGDLTSYGKRENVLVMRETGGTRYLEYLDLSDKDVLNSPYFYLQQNDIVYVEPIKYLDPSGERTLRIIGTIATVVTAASLLIFRVF